MPNDKHLFAVTQWSLKAGIVGTGLLVVAMLCGAVGVIVTWHSGFLAGQLAREAKQIGEVTLNVGSMHAVLNPLTDVTADDVARIALTALAGAATVVVMVQFILRAILRIVVSASVGDPFIARNAVELARVAWLWLGIMAAEVATSLAVYAVAPPVIRDKFVGHPFIVPPVDITLTDLFAALLIFVLARIFRRGTEMRAELEATI
jgi:hypothetical protein